MMRNLLRRIACSFGLHRWHYFTGMSGESRRLCQRMQCLRIERRIEGFDEPETMTGGAYISLWESSKD